MPQTHCPRHLALIPAISSQQPNSIRILLSEPSPLCFSTVFSSIICRFRVCVAQTPKDLLLPMWSRSRTVCRKISHPTIQKNAAVAQSGTSLPSRRYSILWKEKDEYIIPLTIPLGQKWLKTARSLWKFSVFLRINHTENKRYVQKYQPETTVPSWYFFGYSIIIFEQKSKI